MVRPDFFPDSDVPRFMMAMILQIVFAGLTFCLAFISKIYLKRLNKGLEMIID